MDTQWITMIHVRNLKKGDDNMILQYGDIIEFPDNNTFKINGIEQVVPIKFDTIDEQWVVCAQKDATHMLVVANTSRNIDSSKNEYVMIEIGKCDNLYLLADAIVD